MERALAPWLADIAANILCVVLIVLVISAMIPLGSTAPSVTVPVTRAAPSNAAQMVELLRQRLIGAGPFLDLTAEAPDIPTGSEPLVVYVFDHASHPAFVTQMQTAGRAWQEITVPEALHAPGHTGFAPVFLALTERAGDPARFRTDLTRLLSSHASALERGISSPAGAGRLAMLGLSIGRLALAVIATILVLAVWLIGRRGARRATGSAQI